VHRTILQDLFVSLAPKSTIRSALVVAGAGAVIFLLSLAAALLPMIEPAAGVRLVGGMMVLAGSIEMMAGAFRSIHRRSSVVPGAITFVVGGLFFIDPPGAFVPMVLLVLAWLFARGAFLLLSSAWARGTVRVWTLIAAATDLALGGILYADLSASVLPIALFGPSSDVISGFAFVLAISFVATALLLLEVATSEASSEGWQPRDPERRP
jgi:uncharacterized membrane protein HdeD (DUF308 family)